MRSWFVSALAALLGTQLHAASIAPFEADEETAPLSPAPMPTHPVTLLFAQLYGPLDVISPLDKGALALLALQAYKEKLIYDLWRVHPHHKEHWAAYLQRHSLTIVHQTMVTALKDINQAFTQSDLEALERLKNTILTAQTLGLLSNRAL